MIERHIRWLVLQHESLSMSLNEHFRWIAVYVLCGAGMAILGPVIVESMTVAAGIALGGVIVIGGALIHDIAARNRRDRQLDQVIHLLESDLASVRDEMAGVRGHARRLARETLRKLEEASAAGAMEALRAETRSELRSMRAVIDRLQARLEHRRTGSNENPDESVPATATPPSRPLWRSRIIDSDGVDEERLFGLVEEAVRHDRIDLALQPIVSLPQRKLRHYQASAHLRTADGAIITPDQYRRVADANATGRQIDNVLIFRLAQLIRETVRRQRSVGVLVGLSPNALGDVAFVEGLLEFVDTNPELAGNMILTISGCPFQQVSALLEPYNQRLHDLGLRVALEDFGPLSAVDERSLVQLGVRFLKVSAYRILADEAGEASGTMNIGNDDTPDPLDASRALLDRAAVDLIVDDIDDEQTVINLLDHPIDFGQGVLFGEPRLR